MLFDPILEFVRKRSREEWKQAALDLYQDLRSWVQENGEIAAIGGFVCGIVIVAAFKIIVFFSVVFVLLGSIGWLIALPQDEMDTLRALKGKSSTVPDNAVPDNEHVQ